MSLPLNNFLSYGYEKTTQNKQKCGQKLTLGGAGNFFPRQSMKNVSRLKQHDAYFVFFFLFKSRLTASSNMAAGVKAVFFSHGVTRLPCAVPGSG